MRDSFSDELKNKCEMVNTFLHDYLRIIECPQKIVYEAMAYSLFAGGKRIRPILMIEVCKMCGGNVEQVIPFAVAMEMIHTYSLIHDDLPAMDDDDLRRGMPTNHVKFGYANAILAGDGLLNMAFEIMSNAKNVSPEKILSAIKEISFSSGTKGMIGGQIIDIAGCNNIDELKFMYSLKTGAIIKSSCVVGAIISNATHEQIMHVRNFADYLGLAFQIQDDVLDVLGDVEVLGKPIGSDEQQNKNTFVTLLGLEKSKELMIEYYNKAVDELKTFGESADFLENLTQYLMLRDR